MTHYLCHTSDAFWENTVSRGRSTAVIAIVLFINLMAVRVAQANELGIQDTVSAGIDFHQSLGNEAPNLPSSSIDPASQLLEHMPDMDAVQPIILNFRPAQPSGKSDIDSSQRAPEPGAMSLFATGVIAIGLSLRPRLRAIGKPAIGTN